MNIGILVFPEVTSLDFVGPFEVLHRLPGARVHLVGETAAPVRGNGGIVITPSSSFSDCPDLDMICIPGGAGIVPLLNRPPVLDWVSRTGQRARFVTSVCTGSLLLGAAGFLAGKRATCHWAYLDLLAQFGAIPVAERVVQDGALITGGGVTSGIDFGLTVAALLCGEDIAKAVQLGLEYDPAPPFACGNVRQAHEATTNIVRQWLAPNLIAASTAIVDHIATAQAKG